MREMIRFFYIGFVLGCTALLVTHVWTQMKRFDDLMFKVGNLDALTYPASAAKPPQK